jgi:hypothetical protein
MACLSYLRVILALIANEWGKHLLIEGYGKLANYII